MSGYSLGCTPGWLAGCSLGWALGCTQGQGFLLARPGPLETLAERIAQARANATRA